MTEDTPSRKEAIKTWTPVVILAIGIPVGILMPKPKPVGNTMHGPYTLLVENIGLFIELLIIFALIYTFIWMAAYGPRS